MNARNVWDATKLGLLAAVLVLLADSVLAQDADSSASSNSKARTILFLCWLGIGISSSSQTRSVYLR